MRVDCIRVTHPYATLGSPLLKNLPFGLHVLGLPLAFILSQDQTLHSISLNSEQFPFHGSPSQTGFLQIKPLSLLKSRFPNSFVLGLIASLLSLESDNLSAIKIPLPCKNRLAPNIYLFDAGPLSISIYSKNVMILFWHPVCILRFKPYPS